MTEVLAVGSDVLPQTVRDAVLARVTPLGADARPLLDIVSLVPGGAELWLLESVAPETMVQLDACLAAGVLREEALTVGFRHEVARLVLEDAVPAARRRRLHAALPRASAPAERRGHAPRGSPITPSMRVTPPRSSRRTGGRPRRIGGEGASRGGAAVRACASVRGR